MLFYDGFPGVGEGVGGDEHNEIMIFLFSSFLASHSIHESFLIRWKYLLFKWIRAAFENKVERRGKWNYGNRCLSDFDHISQLVCGREP